MPSHSLIIVNLGTTSAPEPSAVREFLAEFLSDPMVVDYPSWLWQPILRGIILRSRPKNVAKLYESIWSDEGSPLDVETKAIVQTLRHHLDGQVEVRHAYRYGQPCIPGELRRAKNNFRTSVTLVPLFPQQTGSTTGTVDRLVAEHAEALGVADRVRVAYLEPDDPGYVRAQADRWDEAVRESGGRPDHLVVSFHGIPTRYDRAEASRYRDDCARTFRALLDAIDWPADRATLAYQSKFGPEPWITPPTAETLERLGRDGVKSVAVMTPGFLTEGLETIEEIGIQGRETFLEAGGERYMRVGCVGAHPSLVTALADLGRET